MTVPKLTSSHFLHHQITRSLNTHVSDIFNPTIAHETINDSLLFCDVPLKYFGP